MFATLAARLLDGLALDPADIVLDLGTGTGVVARLVAPAVRAVVGIDLSAAMLAQARGGRFVCADAHALPLPPAAFDVALAAFCFNETKPACAFAEAHRVLREGGRLALLEWGPADPLMLQVDETLAEFAPDAAAGFHAGMRRLAAARRPWDEAVADCGDLADLLRAVGFKAVACEEIVARVPFTDGDAFLRYALAWPPRRVEVEAMSARARFIRALRACLGAGALVWEPALFRAFATR